MMETARRLTASVFLFFVFLWPVSAAAQQDIQALREEMRRMKAESDKKMRAMEEKIRRMEAQKSEEAATKEEVAELKKKVQGLTPGFENFLLTGYATGSYADGSRGNSTFGAGFNPVFLWSLNDRLFFEGEVEFELEDRETETNLEYAQIHYLLNDYVTVGAGKFLVPFAMFQERLHPAWINKLPSVPIPFQHHGGIAPTQEFGFQVRGAAPLWGEARSNFAFYVANGPTLVTSGHHAGELNFGNADDNNNNKALGGRVGILPIPEFEVGFSYMRARVGSGSFRNVHADLFGADATYVRTSELLRGNVDFRFEYAQQWIDNAIYGTRTFNNSKSGWYAQLAYRPSGIRIPILPDLEGVFRYTNLKWPSGTAWGGGVDRQQYSFGLNYWLRPNAVFKIGFDLADNEGRANDENFFRLQLSYGF